jgi:ATP-dependent Lhr-like helicase
MSTGPADDPGSAAVGRLHTRLQEVLYRMRWTELRRIQVEALGEILDGDGDLIIAAQTASGKTEAAFLPILSRMAGDAEGGVRAIYAGPLKALINDQFQRLERLCELAEIPVHRWHGDVSAADKTRLLDQPSGVLLITPESIESLFVNHPRALPSVFARLSFAVIDELHVFLGSERGIHLKSLLARLSAKSKERVRTIGLSATLGDMEVARRWLRPRAPEGVKLIIDKGEKTVRLQLSGYLQPPSGRGTEASSQATTQPADDTLMADLFDAFVGKTALIFANSKTRLERCADYAIRECQRRGMPNRFRIHHGSLSKAEREETEEALRSAHATATFCSSTLELGIDVGNVESVGQLGAAWSVSSLAQRLGRSGRKEGQASELRMYVEEEEPDPHASLVDRLFPELLQAVAMVEQMLAGWCEPAETDLLHLSTLVQQVMSLLVEQGGVRADEAYDTLVERGAFVNIDRPTFVQMLRDMGAADLIEQTPEGALILGLKGESIARNYDFYTAFDAAQDFRVVHDGRHIGNVTALPSAGVDSVLILAGQRWRIIAVDRSRKTVVVEPAAGGQAPWFRGVPGPDIHPNVRRAMREVLASEEEPRYLDKGAIDMLARARATARESGILDHPFVVEGPRLLWFPWTGDRIQRTLAGYGRYLANLSVHDDGVSLVFEKTNEAEVRRVYARFLEDPPSAEALAERFPDRAREKYEPFLSEALLTRSFARERLDLPGAVEAIKGLMT